MESDRTGEEGTPEAGKETEGKLGPGATYKLRLVPKPERKCFIDKHDPERIKIHEANLRRMAERRKLLPCLWFQGARVIPIEEAKRVFLAFGRRIRRKPNCRPDGPAKPAQQ